ncbi:MAG: hypothetical protein FJ109_08625 [Deltaproteobacteria bacterium]|nr:hypothetical protein [Deltaproteobacteria bacterium]
MRRIPWLGLVVVVVLASCREEAPDPWSRTSDPFVAAAGERLESLERAFAQEEAVRNRIVALAAGRSLLVARLSAGDPKSIDEAKQALVQLSEELDGKKAGEDARLAEPLAAVKAARELLDASEKALRQATQEEAGMEGTLLAGDETGRCGSDGCGGQCGACEWSEVCVDLVCRCLPDCEGKECGPDGCGGVCGTGGCGSGQFCSESGQCSTVPTETVCRADCRGMPRGPFQEAQWVRDFSARAGRAWKPEKLDSLEDAEQYLAALRERRSQLAGLIAGGDQLIRELSDVRAKLEATKSLLEQTGKEAADGKKALNDEVKALKKLPEGERAAGEERVRTMTEAQVAREAALAQLKTDLAGLTAKVKELEGTIRRTQKDLPRIEEGKRRIEPEIAKTEKGVARWKELKGSLAERAAATDKARAALAAAQEALKARTAEAEENKRSLEKDYEPLLKLAETRLESLSKPAFDELLVGAAQPNGLNHESEYIMDLRDPGRLRRVVEAVSALLEGRRAAWDELPPTEREAAYPSWKKEMDWMEDYLQILAKLAEVTTRSKALEDRLLGERERVLKAIDEGTPLLVPQAAQ